MSDESIVNNIILPNDDNTVTLELGCIDESHAVDLFRELRKVVFINVVNNVSQSELVGACENLIQVIKQLIPEPSARGVADVILFQARNAIANARDENLA